MYSIIFGRAVCPRCRVWTMSFGRNISIHISTPVSYTHLDVYKRQVWTYVAEMIFNMMVLVGLVKGSDRIVREMMSL